MPGGFSLQELLTQARRRELTHLILDKTALALAIALGGVIVLLLAGTEILDWYWVALLALISLGVGLYKLRQSVPTLYGLAQRIDRKLNLTDALSTAFHFSTNPLPERQAVCDLQRREAEAVSKRVDLRAALPFARSRYAIPAAGLALVAAGLFAMRFAVTGSLDFRPSLVTIAYDSFFRDDKLAQAKKARRDGKPMVTPDQAPDSPETPRAEKDLADQQMLNAADPKEANGVAQDNSKSSIDGVQKEGESGVAKDGSNADKKPGDKQDGKESSANNDSKGGQNSPDPKEGSQSSKPGESGDNSSMLDKLRDALSSLVNKMKPNPSAETSKNGQSKPNPQQGTQKGQQPPDQNPSVADNQQGQPGDQKSAESKSNDGSSDKNPAQDSKNGVGSKDGTKDIKEAQQQEAMGKISEILGKRSATVTGEVMVEVGNSKQQLKTAWTNKDAIHKEAGGELNRDEVPLMYQQFVRQYFEEIRKSPAAPAAPAARQIPAGGARQPKPGSTP